MTIENSSESILSIMYDRSQNESTNISQFQQIISMATRSISTIFKFCDQSLTNTAMLSCVLCFNVMDLVLKVW